MAVPESATYSVEAKVAAHTAFRDLIDTGTAGFVNIRDSADVLLAVCPLDDPCGTVNGGTGQLTLAFDGRDESANATGEAAYAEICESDGTVHLSIPAQAGTATVSGYLVLNTLTIVSGAPVEIISATIG